MRIRFYLASARRSLKAHVLRSLLAIIGIVVGIASVLAVVSVAEGARSEVARQIASLGANLLLVQPGTQREQGVRHEAGSGSSLTAADAWAIAHEIPGVLIAAPYMVDRKTVVAGNRNWSTLVAGITPDYLDARGWTLTDGRRFDNEQLAKAVRVALVGHTAQRELLPDGSAVGRIIRIDGTPYEVVGALGKKGQDFSGRDQDDVMFVPLTAARIFTMGRSQISPDTVHSILVKAESPNALGPATDAILQLLRLRHRITTAKDDDFRIHNLVLIAQARDQARRQFTLLVTVLACVSLFVGGVGVMNIMLVAVNERKVEIGIRMAVGASRSMIRRQFLAEAALLCTLGGVLGLALGYGVVRALAHWLGWPFEFHAGMALLAVTLSTLVGLLFALLPADRAARLDPAVLFRSAQ